MADQPWLRMPIRIGRFGAQDFTDPLVDTNLTVGPYVGPGSQSVPRGLAALQALTAKYGPAAQAKGKKRSRGRGSKEARDNPLGVLRALHSSLTDALSEEPIVVYRPPDRQMPSGRLAGPEERTSSGRAAAPLIMETGLGLRPQPVQGPAYVPVERLPSGRGGDVSTVLDSGINLLPRGEMQGPPIPPGVTLPPDRMIDTPPVAGQGILDVLNPPAAPYRPGSPTGPRGAQYTDAGGGFAHYPSEPSFDVASGRADVARGREDFNPFPGPGPIFAAPQLGPDRPMATDGGPQATSILDFFDTLTQPIHQQVDESGNPLTEEEWNRRQRVPGSAAANLIDVVTGTREGEVTPQIWTPQGVIDPNAAQAAIDAAPGRGKVVTEVGTQQVPFSHFGPELLPGDKVLPPDAAVPPGETPAVVPTVPGTNPPATILPPPMPDFSSLPGVSTETTPGGMSIEKYDEYMKERYPDIDFSNPEQAKADANARRDLERTAMLAQLSVAAGFLRSAGRSWEGVASGFDNAAGVYDKQFDRYQEALQSGADRYAKQQEAQMTIDLGRRKAAIDLYTSDQETRRAYMKDERDRNWEYTKFATEQAAAGIKLSHDDINKYFDKELDRYKPATDQTTAIPDEEARKAKAYDAVMRARERSLALGYIMPPQNIIAGMADQ